MQQMTSVEGAMPPNQDHAAQDRPAEALAAKAGLTAQAGGKEAEMKTRVAKVRQVTPAPAREAAARAARTARERPGQYAAATAVLLLIGWQLWRGGRR